MKPYVIGISGPSCSGKTTLAEAIISQIDDRDSVIISLDSYYYDLSHLSMEERRRHNFDTPKALDFGLLRKHIQLLLAGNEINVPLYLFESSTRSKVDMGKLVRLKTEGEKQSVAILEGLHTFHSEQIRDVLDLKIFIETSIEKCLRRRIERDVIERGHTAAGVRKQFRETVIPMYLKYVLPAREYADLVVDGTDELNKAVNKVMDLFRREID